jgi:hypothetical protein
MYTNFNFKNLVAAISKLVNPNEQRAWLEKELFFKPDESKKFKIPLYKLWEMYYKDLEEYISYFNF